MLICMIGFAPWIRGERFLLPFCCLLFSSLTVLICRRILVRNSIAKPSCIVNTQRMSRMWTLKPECHTFRMVPEDTMMMNHYYVRSYEDWVHHSLNGWTKSPPELWAKADAGLNALEDTRMMHYGPLLKELMHTDPCLFHSLLP